MTRPSLFDTPTVIADCGHRITPGYTCSCWQFRPQKPHTATNPDPVGPCRCCGIGVMRQRVGAVIGWHVCDRCGTGRFVSAA